MPVVHSQSPPTSDLIPSTHVLQFDSIPIDLQIICNFKHSFLTDFSPSIIFKQHVCPFKNIVLKKPFPATTTHSTHGK